jgi:hypothetical protein
MKVRLGAQHIEHEQLETEVSGGLLGGLCSIPVADLALLRAVSATSDVLTITRPLH